jgi:non-homologous end joining protein Ku
LVKAKVEGTEPVLAPRHEIAQVVSLMETLRQSLERAKKVEPVRRKGRKKMALAA